MDDEQTMPEDENYLPEDDDEDDMLPEDDDEDENLPEDEAEGVAVADAVTKTKAAGMMDDDCTKCMQVCREKAVAPGGMMASMSGTAGIVFVVAALALTVFLTPLFDRGKSLFVASILCDQTRPHRGMRWPTGLGVTEYAWLLYHNIMSSLPFVNIVYALGLTYYYNDQTACLISKAPDASSFA